MKYFSKYRVTDRLSKYEIEQIRKLRKISILKDIPFREWRKCELINLIEEYNLFYILHCKTFKNEEPLSISEFVYTGKYEGMSLYENLKLGE